jgi:hypothetical protein
VLSAQGPGHLCAGAGGSSGGWHLMNIWFDDCEKVWHCLCRTVRCSGWRVLCGGMLRADPRAVQHFGQQHTAALFYRTAGACSSSSSSSHAHAFTCSTASRQRHCDWHYRIVTQHLVTQQSAGTCSNGVSVSGLSCAAHASSMQQLPTSQLRQHYKVCFGHVCRSIVHCREGPMELGGGQRICVGWAGGWRSRGRAAQ